MYDHTIVAIATPPGEGGIGVVRLSGSQAYPIAQVVFRPFHPGPLRPYRLRYGHVVDAGGAPIDEALCVYMRAPRSFTREDVVEISCHGGALSVQLTLARVLEAGARLARPGEFTLRAFLNGRIDLTQAEATLDVIRAQTTAGLALAQAQLGGWLAQEVRHLRGQLLEPLAYLTALIDFPEDDVPYQAYLPAIQDSLAGVERLLAGASQGIVYRQGARAALVGRPNVGKSSLLNALLRVQRAIVTPIPGTTRDTLEETANLDGIPVVLIDTAGIRESNDPVEQLGVERSRHALAGADLALLVLDATVQPGPADRVIAELTYEKPTILIWNKQDVVQNPDLVAPCPFDHPHLLGVVATTATTGAGIDALSHTMSRVLLGGAPLGAGAAHLVSSPRHRDALQRAADYLRAVLLSCEQGVTVDLVAGDLTVALNALGEITGEAVGEDLLDTIFARFCIGK